MQVEWHSNETLEQRQYRIAKYSAIVQGRPFIDPTAYTGRQAWGGRLSILGSSMPTSTLRWVLHTLGRMVGGW